MKYAWILFVILLVSCGGNDMTSARAQKALEGFTKVDGDFLKYDKGRSMGEVSGVIQTGESSVEIMFTLVNPPCNGCQPTSNGKATARMTTDGKWILDCVGYENEFGDWITGRQSCNLNQDMDELASSSEIGGGIDLDRMGQEPTTVVNQSDVTDVVTSARAQKALEGFTKMDGNFLKYGKGRSMGEVTGVIQTGESSVEIMFTINNPPCTGCPDSLVEQWIPESNGKATARMTTDGKWILDCISYENQYGSIIMGRQSCNLNLDMDELASVSEVVTLEPTLKPIVVQEIIAVSAGPYHSLALTRSGEVVAWGWRNNDANIKTLEVPSGLRDVVAVAAGTQLSLALTRSGEVVRWGQNDYGKTDVPSGLVDVVAIAAGERHALALTRSGEVVAWGSWGLNNYGQTEVPSGLRDVVAVAAGFEHSLALTRSGEVVAWGSNRYGQADVPSGLVDVVAIAAGSEHSLALTRSGEVVAWGQNFKGQIDIPSGLRDVVAIAAGERHALALTRSGEVVAWGLNNYGQTEVPSGLRDVVAVAAGSTHSLAVTRSGEVVEWGYVPYPFPVE